MFGELTTVGIQCTDLEASKAFYTEKLGLKQIAGGQGWAVLSSGGVTISLWQGPAAAHVLGLTGGKLDDVRAGLEAKGLPTDELQPHPGGRHFNVYDPDGNRVMIAIE